MITVTVVRSPQKRIVAFQAQGHSGMAPRGFDIVCAGVAALTQAAALGLLKHVQAPVDIVDDDGLLSCRMLQALDGKRAEQADAILTTMVLGLEEIAKQFPDALRIEIREG